MKTNLIEHDLYCKILENIPIVCVDCLVFYKGCYLLVRRNNEPCKEKLYFPGGRLFKTESPENAAIRIVKEETGLDATVRKFLGVYNTVFDTGYNGIPVHSVNLTYFLHAKNQDVKLDDQSSDFLWINANHVPQELDETLRGFIDEVFGNQL